MYAGFFLGSPRESEHLEDSDIDGSIILKCTQVFK